MSDEVLETYLRQAIQSEPGDTVTIAWQGGEPTLMGVDFFRRADRFARSSLAGVWDPKSAAPLPAESDPKVAGTEASTSHPSDDRETRPLKRPGAA